MTSTNFNNSDCMMLEPNISIISVADSVEEVEDSEVEDGEVSSAESATEYDPKETLAEKVVEPAVPTELPEEVEEESESSSSAEPQLNNCKQKLTAEIAEQSKAEVVNENTSIFEIRFPDRKHFQNLGHTILNALQESLNANGERFTFKIADAGEGSVILNAFANTDEAFDLDSSYTAPNVESNSIMPGTAPPTLSEEESTPLSRASTPDYTEDFHALFTIDTAPAEKLNTVQVPSYKRSFKNTLDDSECKKPKLDLDKCVRPRASLCCFNCESNDHSIRECTKPRNLNRINRAKKKFGTKQERYHVDVEQRFAHFRPGVVSQNARTAMGLRRGEVPFFFYRMRVLGYPPGWLNEAIVVHSGVSLFNSDGSEVLKSDDEQIEQDDSYNRYEANKIIDYPGFNVNPGPQFYDDYQHHNVPPMQLYQMKEEFIKSLGSQITKGYKLQKLNDLPSTSAAAAQMNATTLEVADMEIANDDILPIDNIVFIRPPPPPELSPERPPPPPAWISSPSPTPASPAMAMVQRSSSPSLADLEAEQQQLLSELQANISTVTENDDSLIDEVIILDELDKSTTDNDDSLHQQIQQTSTSPATTREDMITKSNLIEESSHLIKESHMGTPLMQFSPFDQLPAGNNFKVGVSDVINFENLPDSIGKYEQMKVVIKKVRNTISKLNTESY